MLQTMDGHSVSEMFYGLTPEWWNYYHDPLRKYSPIMSKEHFETTLRNAGFCDVHFLEGNAELQTDAALIFAQKLLEMPRIRQKQCRKLMAMKIDMFQRIFQKAARIMSL